MPDMDDLPITEHPAFDDYLSDPERGYYVLRFATYEDADAFYARASDYGLGDSGLRRGPGETYEVEIGHDPDEDPEPAPRIRRRGDDIPPVSAYAHWNEDAQAIWYAENRYDMEHADEIVEDW